MKIIVLILTTIIGLNPVFSQDDPSRLSIDFGSSFSGGLSIDLGTSIISKKWNNKFLQTGIGFSSNNITIKDIPINNKNQNISLTPKFINIQNRLYLDINDKKKFYVFGELIYGIGIKQKERLDRYSQKKGMLFEQGIGIQFYHKKSENNFQFIRLGFYHSMINSSGDFITEIYNIRMDTRNHLYGVRFSVDVYSFFSSFLYLISGGK